MVEFPFTRLNVFNYLIAILILFTAIMFTRDILGMKIPGRGSAAEGSGLKPASGGIHEIREITAYAPIVEKNPFGAPMEFRPLTKRAAAGKKAESPSDLVLVGTVKGPDAFSFAIFQDKSRPLPVQQEVFAQNEEVYDYGILARIENEWVELQGMSSTRKIPLADFSDTGRENSPAPVYSNSHTPFVKKISEKKFVLNKRKVQESLNNPERIMSDARLFPVIRNGRQEGFRVLEVRPGGIYENLGLRNRDIILKINGLDLTSPEAAVQTMSALKGMNTVNLDIMRNGEKKTLSYQIR